MVRVGSEVKRRETEIQEMGSCLQRVLGLGWAVDRKGGLEFLQERLEEAVAVVKATTTATGNKNKYRISMEIRRMATATVKLRNPVLQDPRKKRGRLEENLMPGWVQFPRARPFRGPS